MTTLSVNYQVNITDDDEKKEDFSLVLLILTLNNVK